MLLDNQATINIFNNIDLLTKVRKSKNTVLLNGLQGNADAIEVDLIGEFSELGEVFYSDKASANILSFAAMADSGASIPEKQEIHLATKGIQADLQLLPSTSRR